MEAFLSNDKYHIPKVCKHCRGVMVYQGVGEYRCEDCNEIDYDDYGKVRNYIEKHKGATAAQIEAAIGVSQRVIMRLLKDGRLQVAADSRTFLKCELCGTNINSGRYCPKCETALHRKLEAEQREESRRRMKGVGLGVSSDPGQRRYERRK